MIGFADGTADHVRWMTHRGIHAYASSYPQVPIQVFFVILVVADPVIVVLLGFVRREGIRLACAVMLLDIVANWVGNWYRIRHDPGLNVNVPWLITLFGAFVLACAPLLLLSGVKAPQLLPRPADSSPPVQASFHFRNRQRGVAPWAGGVGRRHDLCLPARPTYPGRLGSLARRQFRVAGKSLALLATLTYIVAHGSYS
jgi:hypothetical protein